jgi:predicted flap endonuclease-1-like 5' DNA nuclease
VEPQENSVSVMTDLTEVSGIGAKRAGQLKTLGVRCAEDLAKASADDLARKLRIPSKIVAKWVASAKEFGKK